MNPTRVLVVDDLDYVARMFATFVIAAGHEVVTSHSVEDALAKFEAQSFDVVLSDVKMGALGGFDLLRGIRQRSSVVPVVLITGDASVSHAMDAVEAGAFDYVSKPVLPQALRLLLERAIEHKRELTLAQNQPLPGKPAIESDSIIGNSPEMLQAFQIVARAAAGDSSVLILGGNGTGKELVAKALHERGPRAAKPFVPVNVTTITESLAESLLFGHEKGAFTDAKETRQGYFEQANGGTLFLDEIGDLNPALQAKLLRAVQEHRITRVGGTEEIEVDIRLVSATNHDLKKMIEERKFREDLYYRIRVIEIRLPALRERQKDIPVLATYFLARAAARAKRPVPLLTPDAVKLLQSYSWPGNVRELKNTMEGAFDLARDSILSSGDFHLGDNGELGRTEVSESDRDEAKGFRSLRAHTDEYIRKVLDHTGGNVTQAAKILEVSRRTIQRMAGRKRDASESRDIPAQSGTS
ncbi:MAG: sigma-54 dependent transcriptional regulator [Candidatus Eisenbacteria bacterium]